MIDDLKREGLIKPLPIDQKKIEDARALALRDIATARTLLDTNQDWAYNIAYNAVLLGRAGSHVLERVPPGWGKPTHFCGEVCRVVS